MPNHLEYLIDSGIRSGHLSNDIVKRRGSRCIFLDKIKFYDETNVPNLPLILVPINKFFHQWLAEELNITADPAGTTLQVLEELGTLQNFYKGVNMVDANGYCEAYVGKTQGPRLPNAPGQTIK